MKKELFYDLETSLFSTYMFGVGKTRVSPNQISGGYFNRPRITLVAYKWAHESKVKYLTWGSSLEEEHEMIYKFLQEVSKADVVIGKNNHNFDDKHINTAILMAYVESGKKEHKDLPYWKFISEDLQKLTKKSFRLPSHALDYISQSILGEGKLGVTFTDWRNILSYRHVQLDIVTNDYTSRLLFGKPIKEIITAGKASLKLMIEYGCKDVEDTEKLYKIFTKFVDPKISRNTCGQGCVNCGSINIVKNGTVAKGTTVYQKFYCKDHNGYAGIKKLR